jgi:succinoglycan biosynthesis protein ExoL
MPVSKVAVVTSSGGERQAPSSPRGEADVQALAIAFFGHDANESTVRKRAKAFASAGCNVIGFMFQRRRNGPVAPPEWTNFDLGATQDGRYGRRLAQLWGSLAVLWRERRIVRSADVLYARNIDMLLLARIAKAMARSNAPLVYEALDVHPAMTKAAALGAILRFVERWLLKASALLVVSSPAFIERYFVPVQDYGGDWFLLENKVSVGNEASEPPAIERRPPASAPWTIGWFGVLRCRRSLELLRALAADMPERVIVHLRGIPSEPDGITEELLHAAAAETKNVVYFGPYQSPRDLPAIYRAVDLAWAADFSASGVNSDWLIPNRLYEGGLYGVPAIARRFTATGDIVEADGRGWCFAEPFDENVRAFVRQLDGASYGDVASRLSQKDRSAFVDVSDTAQLLSRLAQIARPAARKHVPAA